MGGFNMPDGNNSGLHDDEPRPEPKRARWPEHLPGIEVLRIAVRMLNDNRESCNQRFTAEELLRIVAAWRASGWDIMPDQWSEKQLRAAAKRGIIPTFNDDGSPTC